MRILLTNDDGIGAPGLAVMARHLAAWVRSAPAGEERDVLVVAPHENHSGMSAAVGDVFRRPSVSYSRHRIEGAEEFQTFALEASPALCTILGALGSFDVVPDLVISGVNAGANVGRSVLHSGTIGAILTGGQLGLPGIAVSVQWGETVQYETAASVAMEVLDKCFTSTDPVLLNLNVPNLAISELRGVRRGRISRAGVVKAGGPAAGGEPLAAEGQLPILFGEATPALGDVSDEDADEDGALLVAGFASLTPLRGPREDVDPAHERDLRVGIGTISGILARLATR